VAIRERPSDTTKLRRETSEPVMPDSACTLQQWGGRGRWKQGRAGKREMRMAVAVVIAFRA
jgi:hypothetical protein